jgi:hypothetical protein
MISSRHPEIAARQRSARSGSDRPDRPELPQDAHVPRAQVLVEVRARGPPLVRHRAGAREEFALPLEQAVVLAGEHLGEQLLLSLEVVVDEGELNSRAFRDRPRRRLCVAVGRERVARRVEDQRLRVGASGPAQIDLLVRS